MTELNNPKLARENENIIILLLYESCSFRTHVIMAIQIFLLIVGFVCLLFLLKLVQPFVYSSLSNTLRAAFNCLAFP